MATKTTTKATGKSASKQAWTSRAATRLIEPGSSTDCTHCDERVKFQARIRATQVICNVYVAGVWDRVEHYHSDCYELAGSPYGEPST